MTHHTITLFSDAYAKTGQEYSLNTFLENIKNGTWKKAVQKVRNSTNEDIQKKLKEKLPAVTISGLFKGGKSDSDLQKHSNFLAIDLDYVTNVEKVKAFLEEDPYTYAVFTSCRGKGLCIVVKIEGKKHKLAFDGLTQYYFQLYSQIVDPSGRNVSRLRFVSYDPDLFLNEESKVFKQYPEKEKKRPDTRNIFFGTHDIDYVFNQIQSRQIDITGGYHQWCTIAFALADYFGEAGRERFLAVSQFSSLYDAKKADMQFSACLRHNATSLKKVTIATFLWYCKQQGISIISDQTKAIVQSAKLGKNGSNTAEGTVNVLHEVYGMDPEITRPIVEQVYASPSEKSDDQLPIVVQLQKYWKEYQTDVRRNVISKKCYRGNIQLTERDLMDIYMDASLKLNINVPKETVADMMKSSMVPEFNPLCEFFEGMSNPKSGYIRQLAECLRSPQGHDYAEYMLTKWMMSCIASVYGRSSQVMLTLCGEQGKGKSVFFLKILPEWFPFRSELICEDNFKRNDSQNNKLLLITRWIVVDDEFKSIEQIGENALKAYITQTSVNVRFAFERVPENIPRFCNLVGTSNENTFLKDPTGNRRFPIIETGEIDQDRYNTIDKYELWKEAYFIYLQNPDSKFDANDFQLINEVADSYLRRTPEQELLLKFYEEADEETGIFRTTTEILNMLLGSSNIKNMNTVNLGRAISALKWKKITQGRDRTKRYGYWVKEQCLPVTITG
ncbi:VapE domain-containing protein [Xanthocytophaga flava]|uniref:VapE domain-containing protein n=1 Tax=Xanthocytophaga flava TaxID=3048013 RepID=UPI0028D4A624|nr:VapE domain-containing protein [Xanthocytophaga flavus]MDJ1470833.1 VapE family protein [Xanthocytophaga flavus]